jgi:ribosomal protein L16 Arg81 hydroxylase
MLGGCRVPEPAFSFAHLLRPVGIQAFLERHYEREPLLIQRERPSHYQDLLCIGTIEEMVSATSLTGEDIVVVDHARPIRREDYLREDETPDPLRIHRLFDAGATISLRQLQHRVPALAHLCRSAEQTFSCPFQTNLYFTPASAQGFETHHDTHDVFILQLNGSKRWRTYEPVVELPLPGQRYYWSRPPGPPVREFTLHAGDLFYCPRGTPHDASAVQEASVHISLGALVSTWAELLLEVVADVILRDPAFRAGLPPDFVRAGVAREVLDATFEDLYRRLRHQARPRHILALMADRFISGHPALLSGQASALRAAEWLTGESTVHIRSDLIYRIIERRGKITLICNERRITLPSYCSAGLKFALTGATFRVADLPGPLTGSGRIVLIRRLVQEGVMVPAGGRATGNGG